MPNQPVVRPLERGVERYLVRGLQGLNPTIEVLKLTPTGRAGYQDRLILVPGALAIFCELKRPGGKLRQLQLYRAKRLRAIGFAVRAVTCVEEADDLIEEVAAWLSGAIVVPSWLV